MIPSAREIPRRSFCVDKLTMSRWHNIAPVLIIVHRLTIYFDVHSKTFSGVMHHQHSPSRTRTVVSDEGFMHMILAELVRHGTFLVVFLSV